MSGHSHWATTHRAKGVNDAKRAAVFTKYGRNIIVAAAAGGGNPDSNYSLKIAIDAAKSVNMPKDNIDRAIKRGTGELKDGAQIEELTYEAYGPGQVALLIETMTDSKNRTVSEVKSILTKGSAPAADCGPRGSLSSRCRCQIQRAFGRPLRARRGSTLRCPRFRPEPESSLGRDRSLRPSE